MAMRLSRERRLLAAKVVQLYYDREAPKNVEQIAGMLGVNKATVSRLMKAAWEEGMLQVHVVLPRQESLEYQLMEKYKLAGARVAPALRPKGNETSSFRRLLGESAAKYLDESGVFFAEHFVVSLGCGATVREIVAALAYRAFEDVRIRQMVIETDVKDSIDETPFTLLGILHRKWGKRSDVYAIQPLPGTLDCRPKPGAPMFAESALELAAKTDTAVVGIGSIPFSSNGGFERICAEAKIPFKALKQYGAVGEMLNRPFDKDGRDLFDRIAEDYPVLRDLTQAPPLSLLQELVRNNKRVVAVAGGAKKTAAIRVALEQHWVSHLVTDVDTAGELG